MTSECPLCHLIRFTVIYKNVPQFTDSDIVRCDACGHFFTAINKSINVNDLYADEIYQVVENRNSIFDKIINNEYNNVLHQLNKFKPSKGNLLDFGCGKGNFASLAASNGWKVKAVETAPARAQYARETYGLEVNSDFFSRGAIFDVLFDGLTLFHVLEHLPDPAKLLKLLVKDNTGKKAVIIVEVPNITSWQSRMAKDRWIHLDVPRHISHFSPQRLKTLLVDISLKPLKMTYFSFHVGVLGMVDCLLKKMGYKQNIYFELKHKKRKRLLLMVAFIFPFAFMIERVAAWFGKGGVIRVYAKDQD